MRAVSCVELSMPVCCLELERGLLQGRKPSLAQCPRQQLRVESAVPTLGLCASCHPSPSPQRSPLPWAGFAQPNLPPRASQILRTSPAGAPGVSPSHQERNQRGIFTSEVTLSPASFEGWQNAIHVPACTLPSPCNNQMFLKI